jgi:hypothetical protein
MSLTFPYILVQYVKKRSQLLVSDSGPVLADSLYVDMISIRQYGRDIEPALFVHNVEIRKPVELEEVE